ncbi:hypothetical protein NUW58_g2110 [Xylaria curta]|uniref:Uncharacterized protein n=1 Tax=Xylaria curta TaxID=42375 RepID=A0ACC1PIQ9_9PEZI|nr:hypothetical protein NUW58_g2110 [Xylaria curta]
MADLKYIIDVEDDEDLGSNKYSRQPSLPGSARNPNPSSTTKCIDDNPPPSNTDLAKSQPRRRGLLGLSSKPTTTASSTTGTTSADKASPSRSPLVERRSIDSTESMDPVDYTSYAHSPSSSNMPPSGRSNVSSRPMPNVPGESSIPVRLTPITGRVSRAKKGVPVHICDVCKPPKTFTRAEHLRRHQLSHKPAAFPCPYPGYSGSLTYEHRKGQSLPTHDSEQDERSGTDISSDPRRRASHTLGFLQNPMLQTSGLSIQDEVSTNSSYPGSASPYSSGQRDSFSAQGPVSPSAPSSRSHSIDPTHSHSQDEYILSSVPFGIHHHSSMDGSHFHSNLYGLEFQPRRPPPYPYMSLEELPSLTIPDSNFPGHLSQESNWPSSASDSPYSTPDRAMIRGYDSPTPDVANSEIFCIQPQYPSPQLPVYRTVTTDYPSYADDASYYELQSHAFSVRSPILPTVTLSAQTAEHLVTLGSSVHPPAVLSRQKGPAALLGPYTDAVFLTSVPSAAALNAIPRYLDVYWKRFDTLFPLVHRRSLEKAADPILRCAMAAVGSQFLRSKEDRINSHILHGYALQEAGHRPRWSIHVMQTILLCEFYGRFRGSKAAFRPSEPFRSIYLRDHLLSLVLSPSNKHWRQYSTSSPQVPNSQTSIDHDTSTDHQHWDEWIVAESCRRLLAAYFVLDIHTSMYHEHSFFHDFHTPTPPIPLVKPSQHLWAAQDSETWQELLSSDPAQLKPASLADEETTASHVNAAPPLDRAVYLAAEAFRLPRRSPVSTPDISADLNLDSTKRISNLFPESAVANTYLALHHTPLRDLLAVSGDSWLFSKKILEQEDFLQRKASVKSWSSSVHAGAASGFAAKALLAFFDTNDNTPNSPIATEESQQGGDWTCQKSQTTGHYMSALSSAGLSAIAQGAARDEADMTILVFSPTSSTHNTIF